MAKQANSVSVHDGVVVAAVEAEPKQAPGKAVFFDAATGGDGFTNSVTVGALPDMVTFTPDGSHVLVANEGEPDDDYKVDPEGSISVIDLSTSTPATVTQGDVATADFSRFNAVSLDPSVKIDGPGATVAQDLEPEYIAVYKQGSKWRAAVTLQENNAIATVNVHNAKVIKIHGLGFKDHSDARNALDASNKDDAIQIRTWPVHGMYQPDSIVSYVVGNKPYLITANEGDAREYEGNPGFVEETRVKEVILDPTHFPDAATLQLEENLGRLKITTSFGDVDNDGDYDKLFSYGARSFSIWSKDIKQVYDSASDVGHITASMLPNDFNSDDEENDSFDDRSDDKGAEVEGLAVGEVNGRTYGFIGLERTGGIMVYDISDPAAPFFVQYINTRDFSAVPGPSSGGDMSPEGLAFIKAADSPNGEPLLVVSYEVSGTTTIFQVKD